VCVCGCVCVCVCVCVCSIHCASCVLGEGEWETKYAVNVHIFYSCMDIFL